MSGGDFSGGKKGRFAAWRNRLLGFAARLTSSAR